MPRTARAVVGGVVVFVLVLVAAVAGLVSLVGRTQADGTWLTGYEEGPFFRDPVTVSAEVLDVDGDVTDEYGWASVDVVFTTPDGEREVAMVDYGEVGPDGEPGVAEVPAVGDVIEVVHERDDPSWVVRADDPMLTGQGEDTGPVEPDDDAVAAAEEMVRDSGRLAVGALLLAVLAAVGTVVAVRRAPPTPAPAWAEAVPEQGGPPPPPGGLVDRATRQPSAPSSP